MQKMWFNTYMGHPEFLGWENGTDNVSQDIEEKSITDEINTMKSSVEYNNPIFHVELYHAALLF